MQTFTMLDLLNLQRYFSGIQKPTPEDAVRLAKIELAIAETVDDMTTFRSTPVHSKG